MARVRGSEETTIAFGGDTMLGRLVDETQRTRDVTRVWGDLLPTLYECDGVVLNLECCLTTRGEPWQETYHPFHFRADPAWAVPALRHAGVDCVSLANNHVLDYGPEGLYDTFDALTRAGIASTGAGCTRDSAFRPAVFLVGDLTVALCAFTDNTSEFAASEDGPGTAYLVLDTAAEETVEMVRESLAAAREADPDLLVVSLHWGPNMRTRPTAAFREFAHFLVNEGVDVVFGHSAHVFQGVERYGDGLICYDAGDLVDDYAVDPNLRNDRSFLFVVSVGPEGALRSLRLIPTEIGDRMVNHAANGAADRSRRRMQSLSSEFGTTFDRDGQDLVLDLSVPADGEKGVAG
ncbi:CapA family protein [Haloarchaeobius sp. DFWS5]|uniref:CapA family protein n=1 Tax=Haloarchaeobius sp. DFWS5 TaxID=3446114 RepID=UPI003EB9DF57